MRAFAVLVCLICAVSISGFLGGAFAVFADGTVFETTLVCIIALLSMCLAGLFVYVRQIDGGVKMFEQTAQDHLAASQKRTEDLARDLDAVHGRAADLKRDFVAHLAGHATIIPPVAAPDTAQDRGQVASDKGAALPPPSPADSIAAAIRANRIDLFVQPTVTLPNRKTVFYECLSRLRSEAGETLYPNSYLTQAARTRMIGTLDNFLLLRCVQIIRRLHRKAPLETFFLNISAASLNDPDFYDQFIEFLCSDASLSKHLVLELQSSHMGDLLPRIGLGLQRLHAAGYRFALDGAQPDDVTEDMAVRGFMFAKIPARSIASHESPQTVMQDAKAIGVTIIATHVEDEKTLIDMTDIGVEHAQGFLIEKPIPWDIVNQQKERLGAA